MRNNQLNDEAYRTVAVLSEDRRTAHPTCALLLVAIGREPSNAAAVRGYAAEGRGLAHTSGIRRVHRGANLDDGAGLAGKVSAFSEQSDHNKNIGFSGAQKTNCRDRPRLKRPVGLFGRQHSKETLPRAR